jgi:hypothetical protein
MSALTPSVKLGADFNFCTNRNAGFGLNISPSVKRPLNVVCRLLFYSVHIALKCPHYVTQYYHIVMILFESEIKGWANYMMKMVFLYSIFLYFTRETNFCWLKNTFCSELQHVFPSFNKLPSSENSNPKRSLDETHACFQGFFFNPFNFVIQPFEKKMLEK